MKQYSFSKGLKKTLIQVGIYGGSIGLIVLAAQYPGLTDTPIADLVSTAVRKVIGGLTVGGAVSLLINWLKNRTVSPA